jgi:hypothetical protein
VHLQLNLVRQCALLGSSRLIYDRVQAVSPEPLQLVRILEQQYTDTPSYEVRRMTA